MLQVRKLVLAVAAATAFSSGFANALGLGELAVKSSLNQPLNAEISLLEVRDLTSVEIKTHLASPEAFSKAGVDRQFFLTGLKFTPVIAANGKSIIRVTSSKPVNEPYLSFLVEVVWPSGRLLREYTLLLDPPLYKPKSVIYTTQPAVVAAPSAVRPTSSQVSQQANAQPTTAQSTAQASSARSNTAYRVRKDDNLWYIAKRVSDKASVQQAMLAIQDLNPNAFSGANINRMKSGQVLQLPTAAEINRRSRAEALAQVAQQNVEWQAARAAPKLTERQLDATSRSEVDRTPARVEQADNLRLVADMPGQAEQAADQGPATDLKTLQDQLASSQARLDSTVLEYQDLKGRVEDLNSQLDKLQHLIELKDNLLAQLQNTPDLPEPLENSDPAADTQLLDSDLEQTTPLVAETDAELMPQLEEPNLQPAAQTEAALDSVEPSQVQAQDESLIDESMLSNPMLLAAAGGGAILALLLLLMAVSRSNARKEAALDNESFNDTLPPDFSGAIALTPVETDFLTESDFSSVEKDSAFDKDFSFDQPVASPQFKQEVSDPIAEANSYISFARFTQAAEVLNNAIAQEPQRTDLRFKLLDVLAALEDQAEFASQAHAITEIGGADTELDQVKARYPQMVLAEKSVTASVDDDFADLNLDDLALDIPADLSTTAEAELDADLDNLSALMTESESADLALTEAGLDDKTVVDEFDFDLDLPELVVPAVKTTEQSLDSLTEIEDSELNLDIDTLDFNLERSEYAEKADNDDALSLDDLSLYLPETSAVETSESPEFELPDDFDFVDPAIEQPLETDFTTQLDTASAELEAFNASLDNAESDTALHEQTVDTLQAAITAETDLGELEELGRIDDDFGFLSGADEAASKLDLARAYVEMGDAQGAREILDEVLIQGTAAQQNEARELISQLG
ncbi:FimV/HubP family polar landmark protein [Denitrificimonas caeni]|uniref:FimV/HubP family polar landmark protein n=1 Tax=Denitrificimonas caeni TaxID=521720 RepID=UPI001964B7BA|nr:FimV/HubP family polar landmark protein [Denitrificimonas caeni]